MPIVLEDVGDTMLARFVDCRVLGVQETDELLALLKERDRRKLVVDLKDIEYINSTALGRLINLQKSLAAHGGKVCLCHVIPQIHEVLIVARLDKIFTILRNGPDGDDGCGVASRLIPPKPPDQESVKLPPPPSEPE